MSSYSPVDLAVRSRASLGNVFVYIWQIKNYWHLIVVIGLYFVRVTYQRTLLGPIWLLVHTLLPLLGMMAVFQHVGSFQTGDFPYPLFLISGMSLWTILDVGVKRGMRNLNRVRRFRRAVHAPAIVLTVAGLSLPLLYHVAFVIFMIGGALFIWATGGSFVILITWNLLFSVISMFLTLMLVVGITALTSVVFLIARDVRQVVPPLINFWFFITPIVYPLDALPEPWRTVCQYVNPMATIIQVYRYGLFGIGSVDPQAYVVSAATVSIFFLFGAWFLMRSDWILDEII